MAPARANVPAGHIVAAPVVEQEYPAGHVDEQVPAPIAEYVPGAHGVAIAPEQL